MTTPQTSRHFKYDRSIEEWESWINDPERNKIALTWLKQENTFDRWRHNRMYAQLSPFVELNKDATWLTVGDGRYGTDANALMRLGAQNVHSSDISDKLLKIGAQEGFINEYSVQNAEALSFDDGSFDYVLCKETYHHLPRPHIALHEMFRVAKKAVILIEPRDLRIDRAKYSWVLQILKKILGRNLDGYGFEPVGNFVFSLSERECEKLLLGMNYQSIAFNGLDDVYEPGVEFLSLTSDSSVDKRRIFKLKTKLFLSNLLSKTGVRQTGLVCVAMFKDKPDSIVERSLNHYGWRLKSLPRNPFI